MFDVVLQLGDQGVDAVELAFAAQEVGEANLGSLAVDVAFEVEQVSFEQRVISMLVERRTPAEVERARVNIAVRSFVPAGVHAVGGNAHDVGYLDIGGREAEQPSALVADDDDASCLERPAE